MHRLSLGYVVAIALAGCGPKEFGSQCDQPNAPAECMQACDPAPGAPATCPGGYHCAPDGMCDKQCSVPADCGSGYTCTSDGRCVDDGTVDDPPVDMACPDVTFTPMPTTPSIGLVLDQSGSMYDYDVAGNNLGQTNGCVTGSNPANCRFRVMREALVGTSGVVSGLESKAYFGASLYTCDGSNLATTNTPRALNNASAIRTAIDNKISTRGGNTPTNLAIDAMVDAFQANPPPADSPPAIVIATDGLPNRCSDGDNRQSATVQAARDAFAAGIPVYVLAIGTNGQHFQDVANAGQGWQSGDPNVPYYPATNAADLQAAFQTIINGVISCDLSLTSSIDATQAMNGMLTINGQQLQYGSDWILVNGNIIRVQGQACTNLKSTPNPNIQASFPCGSIIL